MPQPAPINNKVAIILTALEVETRAVLRQIGPWTDENVNGTSFFRGEFEGWDIAVAEIGAGNVGAAAITTRAIDHYHPSVALFVGVGGGAKDVLLGNVVVATKLYGYEAGKDTAGGFKTRPDVMTTSHEIQQRARALRLRGDWKKRVDPNLEHQNLEVLIGPIAAGEKVVASKRSATAKFLKESYSDALAIEMEGRGFLEGVHINHPVHGCVVRGISDLLSGKAVADKAGSQKRGADSASAVAFEILSGLGGAVATTTPSKPAAKFAEAPATFSPSAYYKLRDVLARIGDPQSDEMRFIFAGVPDAFLRIIPSKRKDEPISFSTLRETASSFEMLRRDGNGGYTDINKYGVIFCQLPPPNRGGETAMHRATQLFQSGEVWSVSDDFVIRKRDGRPDWVPVPLIPAKAFERAFYNTLHRNVAASVSHLGLSFPCIIELGLLGLTDAHLAITDDDFRRIRADDTIVRRNLTSADPAAINSVLLDFFNELYDKTGYPRPPGLYNFPPGAPHR